MRDGQPTAWPYHREVSRQAMPAVLQEKSKAVIPMIVIILLIGALIWFVISTIYLIVAEAKHGHPNYWNDR